MAKQKSIVVHTHKRILVTNPVDPIIPVPPAEGFNGGRSQLGLWTIQYSNDYPFINHLKTAQTWSYGDFSGTPAPDTLDSNGYPISVTHGGVGTVFGIPSAAERPGNWIVRWTGTGSVGCTGLGVVSGTNGRHVFVPGDIRIIFGITTAGITDVAFLHEDDEPDYLLGKIFTPLFLSTLRAANCGVIRFMDWQWANETNIRKWADRKPVTYWSYMSDMFRAADYSGSTTHVGTAFSCSAPASWGGLVDKAIVTCLFDLDVTGGAPTLNVGGTGAKQILDQYGYWQTYSTVSNGKFGTLIYDATLNGWLKFGGDTTGDAVIRNGIPHEVMLALCVELGAHPWVCTPYLACDPITDWQTQNATYWRDNAPAWMIPRLEVVPNECWNGAGGFYSTGYANAKAIVYWGDAGIFVNVNNWVGKVGSTGGQAVSAVYSNNRTRYQSVCGMWFGGPSPASHLPDIRLNSDEYVADGGNAAKNWITHVAVAAYWNNTYTDVQRTAAGASYAAASAPTKLTIATDFVNSTLVDGVGDQYLYGVAHYIATTIPDWVGFATTFNVTLNMYEGGYGDLQGGDANYNSLIAGAKASAATNNVTSVLYNGFNTAGGEFPSQYILCGPTVVWTIFDPNLYAVPSPAWTAITAFNAV